MDNLLFFHMNEPIIVQTRFLRPADIEFIQSLIDDNPNWNRTQLSQELCRIWDWKTPRGQWKDMACREMLRKLEAKGLLQLPPLAGIGRQRRRTSSSDSTQLLFETMEVMPTPPPIRRSLSELQPLRFERVEDPAQAELFGDLLSRYHYLGYR